MSVASLTSNLDVASTAALALGGNLTPHKYNELLATALLTEPLSQGAYAIGAVSGNKDLSALTGYSYFTVSSISANSVFTLPPAATGVCRSYTFVLPAKASSGGPFTITFTSGSGNTYVWSVSPASDTAVSPIAVCLVVDTAGSVVGENGNAEYGSNSNGSYIKFGDGTLICIGAASALLTTSNSTNIVYYVDAGFTYPGSFLPGTRPNIAPRAQTISAVLWPGPTFGESATGFGLTLVGVSSVAQGYLSYIAIGRWKA